MAADWIKMRSNLWDDPRVSALVDATESSEAAIIGGLYWLWATADQHTEDGCMPGLTLRQIDRKTGIPAFGAALVSINWLRDDPQGVVLHNFTEHNGQSAKRRSTDAQRKGLVRSMSASQADKSRTDGGSDADEKRRFVELEEEKEEEKEKKNKGEPRAARAPSVARPDDVAEQVWGDWVQLRKAKRAPVTDTVIAGARSEAAKAGMLLEDFLVIWCRRGSQGLEADWLRANERKPGTGETAYQQSQRERVAEFAPGVAKRTGFTNVIEMENAYVPVLTSR